MYPMIFSPSFFVLFSEEYFSRSPNLTLLIMCGGVGLAGLMQVQVLSLRDYTRTQDTGPFYTFTRLCTLLTSYSYTTKILILKVRMAGNLFPKRNIVPPHPPSTPLPLPLQAVLPSCHGGASPCSPSSPPWPSCPSPPGSA